MEPGISTRTKQRRDGSSGPPASQPLRFSQLSQARQTLVRLCQTIDYGHIQGLEVKDSDPFLNPPPIVMVDLNLDGPERERPEAELQDFVLRKEIARLMDQLDEMKNGKVERIDVRAGIPRRIVLKARLPGA